MFKKAKRANFRRRNDSDEEEHGESHSLAAPTSFGPAVEIPFITETSGATGPPSSVDNSHSNGFLFNSMRAPKKEKKSKEVAPVLPPTKASLLSFDDDEGEDAKAKWLTRRLKPCILRRCCYVG